jgi:hypothetical protein
MFRIVWRVAAGLLAVAAMQQVAAAQTTLSSNDLPGLGAPPASPPSSVATTTPTPQLIAQIPAPSGAPPPNCVGVSPYDNYACLDAYLGDNVFERLYKYYVLEWGQPGAPTDPNASS